MTNIIITTMWLAALCAATAVGEGLKEYLSSDESTLGFSRVFRPAQDLKVALAKSKNQNHGYGKYAHQQMRPSGFVPHGQRQSEIHRQSASNSIKKLKPSPSDPYQTSESRINSYYVPSQKYLQKYASQLYAAQKNAAKLSDYQKSILSQDPAVKGFVFQQPQPLRSAKYLSPEVTTVATTKQTVNYVPSTTTETLRPDGIIRKKATTEVNYIEREQTKTSEDNSPEASAYKYLYEQAAAAQIFTPHYNDKPAFGTYGYYASPQLSAVAHDHGKSTAHLTSFASYHGQGHGHGYGHGDTGDDHYPETETDYQFKYAVRDDDKHTNFGHAETRKGKATYGKYYVQLSDGRFETVKYWADKTGYHAEVNFKGHAKHPPSKSVSHVSDDVEHQHYSVHELPVHGFH